VHCRCAWFETRGCAALLTMRAAYLLRGLASPLPKRGGRGDQIAPSANMRRGLVERRVKVRGGKADFLSCTKMRDPEFVDSEPTVCVFYLKHTI
jgi:hypothetical protein